LNRNVGSCGDTWFRKDIGAAFALSRHPYVGAVQP
jgi:hypothetical protein